jgi:hypothetical protein
MVERHWRAQSSGLASRNFHLPDHEFCRKDFGKIARSAKSIGYKLVEFLELLKDSVKHNDATNIYLH